MQDPMQQQMMQDPMQQQMPMQDPMQQQMPMQDPMMQQMPMQDPMMQQGQPIDPMMQQQMMSAAGGGMMPYRMDAGGDTPNIMDFSKSPISPDRVRILRSQGYSDEEIEQIIQSEQSGRNNSLTGQELYGVGEESDFFKGRTSYPLVPESVTESVKDVLDSSDIAKYGFGYKRNEGSNQSLMGVPMGAAEDLKSGARVMSDLSERARQSQLVRDPISSSNILSLINRGMEVPRRAFGQLVDGFGDLTKEGGGIDTLVGQVEEGRQSDFGRDPFGVLGELANRGKNAYLGLEDEAINAADKLGYAFSGLGGIYKNKDTGNDEFVSQNDEVVSQNDEAAGRTDKVEALKNTPFALLNDVATGINAGNSPEGLEEMVDAGDAGGVKVNPRAASRMAQGLALAQLGAGIASGDLGKGISDASTMFAAQTDKELDNAREDRKQTMLEGYYGGKNTKALTFDKAYELVFTQYTDPLTGRLKEGVTVSQISAEARRLMDLSQLQTAPAGDRTLDPAIQRYSLSPRP